MAVLAESQWELSGVLFGRGCPVEVENFLPGGPEIRTADVDLPGADGTVFGVDTHGGLTLSWDLTSAGAYTAAEARQAWQDLAVAFNAGAARARSRAVVPLRMRIHGGDTVVAYGRPRRFEPANTRLIRAGMVEFAADFRTADSKFYSDTEQVLTLDLIAPSGGGITWPVTWPISWAPGAERQDAAVVAGTEATWPVITFRGPVTNPRLTLVATGTYIQLTTTLAHDRSATIDTRPWAASILRDDGASLAGAAQGARLSELALPPGPSIFHFQGEDLTGAASAEIRWRTARSTP
jgi:hypothetical protein